MKITIQHTPEVAITNGLPLRLWRGETSRGVPIVALVASLGVARSADAGELERELVEIKSEQASPWLERILLLGQVAGIDRFGACVPPHADERARLEAVSALLCLEDPMHLIQALYDAGLRVTVGAPDARAEPWLVRDFLRLYRAAAATLPTMSYPDVVRVRRELEDELMRLRPAYATFDVGADGESDPTPRRQRAAALAHAIGARPRSRALHQAFVVALARDQAIPESHRCNRPTAPLPDAIAVALLDDERASGVGVDPQGGGTFLAFALRGAVLGWHARHAHPGEETAIARAAEPLDEPHRVAFGVGFKLALDLATLATEGGR